MYDLSILIPARNEMFLARTVESLLKNIRGKTEIIVILDGQWADPPLPDDERLTVIYNPVSVGQRAATNQAARISTAKYIMKIDAHCDVDEGFDVKMIEDMSDDVTMVPVMRNLHAFDWLCQSCSHRIYQGPTPEKCPQCSGVMEKDILWKAKESPKSTSFTFDRDLHFQYFGEYKRVQDATGSHLVETMSLQGSCFMLTREKYWELDICDENHGSWGQQGVEVACKTWLSGGRVLCNKRTWYAHMFRTQGGDFGFPYPLSGKAVDKARKYSRELFIENKWPKAVHKLEWLIEKFRPVKYWHDEKPVIGDADKKGIIYYTDNQLNVKVATAVQKRLLTIGLPIVSASLKPMDNFGTNIRVPLERGYHTMFKQILFALEASQAEIIFFCEHDVLYHPSHFEFTPPEKDVFYYNVNWWKVRDDGVAVSWEADQVSGICVYRQTAIDWYRNMVDNFDKGAFKRHFEPMSGKGSKSWKSIHPNIDIRHGKNLTKSKWSLADFRNKDSAVNFRQGTLKDIDGWDLSNGIIRAVALK